MKQRSKKLGSDYRDFISAKQRGFSVIEIGIVMVIIGIMLGFVYNGFASNMTTTNTNTLVSDTIKLSGKITQGYAGNYASVSNTAVQANGYLKNLLSLTASGGTITTNISGSTLTITPGKVNVANDATQYVVGPLPDESCVAMVAGVIKSATTLTVNSNSVKKPGTPINPSAAQCTGDNNTVTWQVQ